MAIQVRASAGTHAGMVREHNEDTYALDDALGFYAVADGVGGKAAGEVASRMAIDVAGGYLRGHAAELERARTAPASEARTKGAELVERAIQEACRAVHDAGNRDSNLRGMRTTLTCVVKLGASSAVVGHVGDSRLYLIRRAEAHRLTDDHTLTAYQVRAGLITEAQALESAFRGTLTRALGSHESVQVDTLFVEIADGDVLLLCSDGLPLHVADGELAARVAATDPASIAGELLKLVNQRGGKDNVTVVTLMCAQDEKSATDGLLDSRIRAVAGLSLFHSLDYRQHVAVLSIAASRRVAAGTILVGEGTKSSELYVIVGGRVAVERGGRRLSELGPGTHFGDMALVEDAPRSATVVALEPMDLLVIGREQMIGLMRQDPVLATKVLWTLVQSLSARLRVTSAEALELAQDLPRDTLPTPFHWPVGQ
jgi:serine/threonine protein phosphatase PrpC/CRP-like cAMP-binding protein